MGFPDYWRQYPKDVREMMESLTMRLQSGVVPNVDEIETAMRVMAAHATIYFGSSELVVNAVKSVYENGDSKQLTQILNLLHDTDENVVWHILRLIDEIGIVEATPILIPLLAADEEMANTVTDILGRLKSQDAVQPIITAMNDG